MTPSFGSSSYVARSTRFILTNPIAEKPSSNRAFIAGPPSTIIFRSLPPVYVRGAMKYLFVVGAGLSTAARQCVSYHSGRRICVIPATLHPSCDKNVDDENCGRASAGVAGQATLQSY